MESVTEDGPSGRLAAALQALRRVVVTEPRVALVLGSGLGGLADAFDDAVSVPYAEVPFMAASTVAGHAGRFVSGRLEGVSVIGMQGRLHPYEGHALDEVVLGVRAMLSLGAEVLVVTNAAGGVDPGLVPGSLMLIEDHINLTGMNCLVGANDPRLGRRFPDMSAAYDPALREVAREVARAQGLSLAAGVYAGVLGPSYETPAEVRMLRVLGAHAVGMSTVQEVIAARHMGARVVGISCITNAAAGLSAEPLSHDDVQLRAASAAQAMTELVRGLIARLGSAQA